MVKIKLITVGKLKEKFYIDACNEYSKRLQNYCKLELRELPEGGGLEKEAALIVGEIPPSAYVIPLCIEGVGQTSVEFAQLIEKAQNAGKSTICLIMGSSEGLAQSVKMRGDFRLSMSPMTFPHHLARAMVLEQIYRAMNILSGGKYHK